MPYENTTLMLYYEYYLGKSIHRQNQALARAVTSNFN